MANEKLICNQICTWNDPSDGCVRPNGRICPMSSAKVDANGWAQVKMANKKRLIDANALCEGLVENHPVSIYARNAPTVDAVEVVRCKDCKHNGWIQEPCHGKSVDFCHVWDSCVNNPDKCFCSYGERRADDG